MKSFRSVFVVLVLMSLASCYTRVVTPEKPLRNNTLELYKNYTIQLNDASFVKMQVLRVDEQYIYGKNRKMEQVTIARSDVREIKEIDYLSSVVIALAAIAAVIFVPI